MRTIVLLCDASSGWSEKEKIYSYTLYVLVICIDEKLRSRFALRNQSPALLLYTRLGSRVGGLTGHEKIAPRETSTCHHPD